MTEVPEHLLQRSRERRAALGLGGGEGAPADPSKEVAETAAAAPAPAGAEAPAEAPPVEAPPEPEPEPSMPVPRARVPVWAMPVLVLLPFWAVIYSGAFGERGEAEQPSAGAVVYQNNCASCHGASGGGGTGPALAGVTETFPTFDDHVAWVTEGSAAVQGEPYGATGDRVATGAMPAFGNTLSEEDIILVVCHERTAFGGEDPPNDACQTPEGEEGEEGGGSETAGG